MSFEKLKQKSRPFLAKVAHVGKQALETIAVPPPVPPAEVAEDSAIERPKGVEAVREFYDKYLQERSLLLKRAQGADESVIGDPARAAALSMRAATEAAHTTDQWFGFRLPEELFLGSDPLEPVALMEDTRPLAVEIVQAWIVHSFDADDSNRSRIHESLQHLRCSFVATWLRSDITPTDIGLEDVYGDPNQALIQMRDLDYNFNPDYREQATDAFMANVSTWG